jgi:hypothetical protein
VARSAAASVASLVSVMKTLGTAFTKSQSESSSTEHVSHEHVTHEQHNEDNYVSDADSEGYDEYHDATHMHQLHAKYDDSSVAQMRGMHFSKNKDARGDAPHVDAGDEDVENIPDDPESDSDKYEEPSGADLYVP